MGTVGLALALVFALCGAGAVLGMIIPDRRNPAWLAWTGSLAALSALWASGLVLFAGGAFHAGLWTIRSIGTLSVSLNRLSAFFLFVAAIVVLASSVFSASYLTRYSGHYSLRSFTAWYSVLFASIVWILIAGDVLGFLLAWEVMSLSSYLLVNFEYQCEETSQAGFLMLAMGEAGFLIVEVLLLFLTVRAGSLEFSALKTAAAGLGSVTRWTVFLLTFFGFGVKAGLVPVNSWLPRAHPAAPANVSAILSGVILNLGLYGIILVNFDLVPVGMVGAGVIFAACHRPILAGMAFIAAFYHMLNHSIYKALLFLGAGAVDDRSGTRDLDEMGGLIRVMPWTGAAFLVGSLAISAVPPFNGFVSEWLTLQTLLRSAELPSIGLRLLFALCGAGLALTAALAVTCFVKAFAMGFLGISRSEQATKAVEVRTSQIAPMAMLAALCLLLGLLPTYVIPALNRDLQPLIPTGATDALVPPFFTSSSAHTQLPPAFVADFHNLGAQVGQHVLPGRGLVVLHRGGAENPVVFAMSPSYSLVALALFLFSTWLIVTRSTRKRSLTRSELWAGGIPRLLPEMSYTATGFSNPVRVVFQAIFRPNIVEDTRETVAVHFRTAIRRRRDDTHLVDRLFFHPVGDAVTWFARLLAGMHHGRLNAYVAYTLGFLLLVLLLFRLS